MNKRPSPNNNNSNRDLIRYASMGTQMLVSLGLGVFLGLQADKWLHTSPLFACILPLLILSGLFYKIYRETSRKNKDE
jgi:F0F1-type ATP synthase assembly protein I